MHLKMTENIYQNSQFRPKHWCIRILIQIARHFILKETHLMNVVNILGLLFYWFSEPVLTQPALNGSSEKYVLNYMIIEIHPQHKVDDT